MRRPTGFFALLLALTAFACDTSETTGPTGTSPSRISSFATGTISVFVHWEQDGIAGKTVEIVETNQTRITGENGIATFRVAPGTYTVRVHEINRGGPALRFIELKASVEPLGQVKLNVVDCLPCV